MRKIAFLGLTTLVRPTGEPSASQEVTLPKVEQAKLRKIEIKAA